MEQIQNKYPIFEANQVLTNTHLNQIFNYLEQQDRLTRAKLIGIGVVCGLEIRLETGATTTIHLSKGCGITSEGYLIFEPQDVALTSYRANYLAPPDPNKPGSTGYEQFMAAGAQYPLWELFSAGEPNTTPLGSPAGFLDDKAVLLFLELKKDPLRNCSPNNCDDKGAEVTATVRKLLISKAHLEDMIAVANGLSTNLTPHDLATALTAKLGLKDLRLPRYDAPNTGLATSKDVLLGFFEVFSKIDLVVDTQKALSAAYLAFKPVLEDFYPTNPFAGFSATFGFLDTAPQNAAQVRFLQYYYDLFDDLLKAYDEFRWAGAELLCSCCPSDELFPRHLMAGEVFSSVNAVLYRHTFLASPAVSDCSRKTKDLRLLFQRLVEMTKRFTNNPPLPATQINAIDAQIRVTPSKLADVLLSAKCIPYYYTQNGDPELYKLWNPEQTRRGRADQNLSYRAEEYASELFARNPLKYDLEPYNFLRIEGHLGKPFRVVLQTLLSLKSQYRLPIEIIALRTGAFDEKMTVDLSKEECRFQDLDTLYRSLRESLRCFLCKEMQYFYDLPFAFESPSKAPYSPRETLLKECAPEYKVKPNTMGDRFETLDKQAAALRSLNAGRANIGIIIFDDTTLLFYLILFLSRLAETLALELGSVDFAEVETSYNSLVSVATAVESSREKNMPQLEDAAGILNWEELDDRIEAIMYACRLDAFKAVRDEYVRRIREVKQRQFLSFFLQKNPGIQHKAGVPMGGTFIIVYHDDPDLVTNTGTRTAAPGILVGSSLQADVATPSAKVISGALNRLKGKADLLADPDFQIVFSELTGQVPIKDPLIGGIVVNETADKIFSDAINQFADGTVIADFFLPYLCCSDCAPVQFVLPPPPIGVAVEIGCTNTDGRAEVAIKPQGGAAPYTYQVDGGGFTSLEGKPLLAAGDHTIVIRDSAGVESAPQIVSIPEKLTIGPESFADDIPKQTYQVSFKIAGGKPPYTADSGVVNGDAYTSGPVKSDETIKIEIKDSAGCKTSQIYKHQVPAPCDLPCKGLAFRCGFRFWMPEPEPNRPYKSFEAKVVTFAFEYPEGNMIDLTSEVQSIIKATPDELNSNFSKVVTGWLQRINKLIENKTGGPNRFGFQYSKLLTEPVGSLTIGYFRCLNFKINIQASYQRPSIAETSNLTYSPDGTTMQIPGARQSVLIPRFDCVELDLCNPLIPEKNLCQEVELRLRIAKKLANGVLTLDVTPTGPDKAAAFLWEVQDGIPPFSPNKQAEFKFEQIEPVTKRIWLTVFTEKGCRVIAEDSINLRVIER